MQVTTTAVATALEKGPCKPLQSLCETVGDSAEQG